MKAVYLQENDDVEGVKGLFIDMRTLINRTFTQQADQLICKSESKRERERDTEGQNQQRKKFVRS